jgi:hypothetical protein
MGWLYGKVNNGFALPPALSAPGTVVFFDSKENAVTGHGVRLDFTLAGPGPPGPQGPKGDPCATGPAGAKGATGAASGTPLVDVCYREAASSLAPSSIANACVFFTR